MELIVSLCGAVTVFCGVYLLLRLTQEEKDRATEQRLQSLEAEAPGRGDKDYELARPFRHRVLLAALASWGQWLDGLAPQALRRLAETRLSLAGGPLGVREFLLLCLLAALLLGGGVGVLLKLSGAPFSKVVVLGLCAFAVGAMVPLCWLNQRIRQRQESMQRDLPNALDLLTISVEAGLGFDGALSKLAEKMRGPLVEEFSRVLQEMRVGVPRREAMAAMGRRCEVADVSIFTSAVIQADQLGVAIGNVLRIQSDSMRERRKQRVEEKAMKAPVKMLLPLVFLIFPCIFIVLLGPAMIQILDMFKK